jgi:ribosomal protein S12 methylthiotransferase
MERRKALSERRKTLYILSLGCPKNDVDSDCLASALARAGWRAARTPDEATVMLINTCSFIVPAVEESLEAIMELGDLRQEGARYLVVTGCLVARYGKASLAALLPEVDLFIDLTEYHELVSLVEELAGGSGTYASEARSRHISSSLSEGYVYVKISEGCNRRCSYCAIPSIRGPLRSRPREEIVEEALFFLRRGAREVILIAQDTTSYGLDTYGRPSLAGLIGDLCEVGGDWWLRIMYMHPEGVDAEILEAMSDPRVCKYLDLPFQHTDAEILRAMGRRGDADAHRRLLTEIREILGTPALRATFMVGFPEEGEKAYASLRDFVAEVRFDWLGLFSYSHEEGTPAFSLGRGVSDAVARARLDELAEIQEDIMLERAGAMTGRRLRVLVECRSEEAPGFWEARSQREAPGIDGIVFVQDAEDIEPGSLRDVEIIASEGIDLIGAVQT